MKRLLILVPALLLYGCATAPLFKFPDGPKNTPQPQYNKIERKTIEPVIGTVTIDGKTYPIQIGYREDYRYDINATPPAQASNQTSFWGWVLNPFKSWWLWLLVIFVIFVPGGWGIFTWASGRVLSHMGQVVHGVEDFLNSDAPEEMKRKLLDSLSKNMDTPAKKAVAIIKNQK